MGSEQLIICIVSNLRGVELNDVMISWTGPGGDVIMNSSRISIIPTNSSDNNFISYLQFEYLMEDDEGIYTCNVVKDDQTGSSSFILRALIGKPSCFKY